MKTPGSRIDRRSSTNPVRADQPIAAAVKGPGAAEGAVPRAAPRELDRGARIERAEKILPAMAQQVARRHQIIERLDKARRRPLSRPGDRTGNRSDIPPPLDRAEKQRHSRLALALEDAVDGTRAMLDQSARGERGAVPADADKGLRQAGFCRFREIDDLRDVREVVAGKSDDIWPPALEQSQIGGVVLDLQVDQPDRVSGAARGLGNKLETQRLEPQKYPGIEERTGMDAEKPHENSLLSPFTRIGGEPWRQPRIARLMCRTNTRREIPTSPTKPSEAGC